jgi:PAS domain-containing protein
MRSLLEKKLMRSEPRDVLSLARKQESDSSAVPLKTARLEAGVILAGAPYPMGLWSLDRRYCVFNSLARELLGYGEDEILRHAELYLDRIHPEDRHDFLSAWKKLRDGETRASCRYRFRPKGESETRSLQEISLSFPVPGNDKKGALTLYAEERKNFKRIADAPQLRGLLRGLTHEIGNNLQAISGELELLRWSGTLPAESAAIVSSRIRQILNLAYDIQEYFFPSFGGSDDEDLASVIVEVLRKSEQEMNASGIRTEMIVQEALPKVPLDGQFAKALKTIIDFSRALLAAGGDLKIEAGACRRDGRDYIQLNVISASRGDLRLKEVSVFRPFINVFGYRPGLSMAVAQRILRRHSGEIVFRKEQANRGVFSVLMRVPDYSTHTDAIA